MTFLMFYACNLPRLNLRVQIALVLLLTTGVLLARAKRFRLHAVLQSAVVLLNLGLILRVMLASFRHQLPCTFRNPGGMFLLPSCCCIPWSERWRGLWLFMSFWLPARR
jgi:hypothetical protein